MKVPVFIQQNGDGWTAYALIPTPTPLHALDTLPSCLPSSNTPTLVLITLSAVVISSLPSFSSSLISDYEDFIITVRLNCSTYKYSQAERSLGFRQVWLVGPTPPLAFQLA